MRIFAYILKVDSGFAPNPFHGWCTLACCKPAIRRSAQPGDWILGITPRALGNDLAYAMRVDETLAFAEYWHDPRFKAKRPNWKSVSRVERVGDNCYEPLRDGKFRQVPSMHWKSDQSREVEKRGTKDLRGERVLVGRRFSYYGAKSVPLPEHVRRPARFNLVNFTDDERAILLPFLEHLPRGIKGQPRDWPEDDTSWQQRETHCG